VRGGKISAVLTEPLLQLRNPVRVFGREVENGVHGVLADLGLLRFERGETGALAVGVDELRLSPRGLSPAIALGAQDKVLLSLQVKRDGSARLAAAQRAGLGGAGPYGMRAGAVGEECRQGHGGE